MPERGKIKKFLADKNIGWVSRDDGSEVFIPPKETPKGKPRAVGDLIEFEVVPDPHKVGKFQAINVKAISEVVRTPGASLPPSPQGELAVKWEKFGNTRQIPIVESVGATPVIKLQLPIWLRLSKGGQPALGVGVQLYVDGEKVSDLVYTDTEGVVALVAYLTTDVIDSHISARIDDKLYTYFWENPNVPQPAAPVTTKAPEVKPTVQKSIPDADGVYTFLINANPRKTIELRGKRNFGVEARKKGDLNWTEGPFKTNNHGRLELEVRGKLEGTLGEVYFICEGIESRPRSVERPNRIEVESHG